MNSLKICTKCKQNQSLNEFSKDKSRNDGLYPNCRSCCSTYKKKYDLENYEKNKLHRIEKKDLKAVYDKQYRDENIKKIRDYEKNRKTEKSDYNFDYARKNPGKMNARTAKRNSAKLQATPRWLSNEDHKK